MTPMTPTSGGMSRKLSDWGFGVNSNSSTNAHKSGQGARGERGDVDERVASLDVLGVSALEG